MGKIAVMIDGKKLRNALKTKGMSFTEAGRKIGCSAGYISEVICSGRIGKDKLMLLEYALGIKQESLRPDPEPEVTEEAQTEPEKATEEKAQVSMDELLEVVLKIQKEVERPPEPINETLIINAVAKGIALGLTAWWPDNVKNLNGTIYSAVFRALYPETVNAH